MTVTATRPCPLESRVAGALAVVAGILVPAAELVSGLGFAYLVVWPALAITVALLERMGAAGTSRAGRFGLWIWAYGYLVLAATAVLGLVGVGIPNVALLFLVVGALGALAGGTAVARAGVLTGWRASVPLSLAVTLLLTVGLVSVGLNVSGLQVAWALVSSALCLALGVGLLTAVPQPAAAR